MKHHGLPCPSASEGISLPSPASPSPSPSLTPNLCLSPSLSLSPSLPLSLSALCLDEKVPWYHTRETTGTLRVTKSQRPTAASLGQLGVPCLGVPRGNKVAYARSATLLFQDSLLQQQARLCLADCRSAHSQRTHSLNRHPPPPRPFALPPHHSTRLALAPRAWGCGLGSQQACATVMIGTVDCHCRVGVACVNPGVNTLPRTRAAQFHAVLVSRLVGWVDQGPKAPNLL